jgi:transposase InsO family protein
MIDYILLLTDLHWALTRTHGDRVAENLLLRHQLAVHRPHTWAADLLRVQTLVFRTLYVLVLVSHGRRELVHFNVTTSPAAAWSGGRWSRQRPGESTPRYVVRDRDAAYGRDFVDCARGIGIRTLLTPVRAPRADAIAGRLVGTQRFECLD